MSKIQLNQFFSDLFGITMSEQWHELFSSKHHSIAIQHHRAGILSKRTKYFSLLFAFIVPLWSIIDYLLLPTELWLQLAVLRFLSGFIFITIAFKCHKAEAALEKVIICMGVMFMTPTVFFLFAHYIVHDYHLIGFSGALINIYSLLPFLVIASLSIFTLTIKELLIISSPIIAVMFWHFYPETVEDMPNAFMFIWLFILLALSSFFSSVSQMRYMISQVTRASYDALTNAMTRRAGIEALNVHYRMASLQESPLSLLFIDLDDFKSLNDDYGHDAGDKALKNAVSSLKDCIRRGDSIIRWGGEEFLILLPNADHSDTRRVLERIMEKGLGTRPDGKALTASMGLAEKEKDKAVDWETLVELADKRMYLAKQQGKARCVGCQEHYLQLFEI